MRSLQVSKNERRHDPTNPLKTVLLITTMTYSMERNVALNLFRLFVDARLIKDATNLRSMSISGQSIWIITPKGLHILERYVNQNKVENKHLNSVFNTQPICPKLLRFMRREADDRIVYLYDTILAVFCRFAGRVPNHSPDGFDALSVSERYREWSKGILLIRVEDNDRLARTSARHDACFSAVSAMEWLCDFTAVTGSAEAARMLANFVRFGLIVLVKCRTMPNNPGAVTVRGKPGGPGSPILVGLC